MGVFAMRSNFLRSRAAKSAILAAALATSVGMLVATPASAEPAATYYVSLGDSLAAGYQPDTNQDEAIAYTDKIYEKLKQSEPNLVHIRLGCSGETTVTMIEGGKCDRKEGPTQLGIAVDFMTAHPGQIKYVTNNIGANDIYRCVRGGTPDVGCIVTNLGNIRTNLGIIDSSLREAGGKDATYVGLTYYNPMLSSWLKGGTGKLIAAGTTALSNILTQTIVSVNSANGWKTADIAAVFSNNDFGGPVSVPGFGDLPTNVARLCTWTWMCEVGDIHANPVGHQVIADAILPLLTTEEPGGAGGSVGSVGSIGALVG